MVRHTQTVNVQYIRLLGYGACTGSGETHQTVNVQYIRLLGYGACIGSGETHANSECSIH